MIKRELVTEVAYSTTISQAVVLKVIDEFTKTVSRALVADKRVDLRGFGIFTVKDTMDRVGRNPRTGIEVKIPASKRIKFKASSLLKKVITTV